MFQDSRADATLMAPLVETRWTRYGHDRVYLKTAEGDQIGHVDLKSGSFAVEIEEFTDALVQCRDRWLKPTDLPPPSSPALSPPASIPFAPPTIIDPPAPPRDLSTNAAGAAARAKRDEVNAEAPVLNFVARVFGVKTDERNWRVGAKGEVKVAKELERLGPHWRVLHADWLERAEALTSLHPIIGRVPAHRMSEPAREFAARVYDLNRVRTLSQPLGTVET